MLFKPAEGFEYNRHVTRQLPRQIAFLLRQIDLLFARLFKMTPTYLAKRVLHHVSMTHAKLRRAFYQRKNSGGTQLAHWVVLAMILGSLVGAAEIGHEQVAADKDGRPCHRTGGWETFPLGDSTEARFFFFC